MISMLQATTPGQWHAVTVWSLFSINYSSTVLFLPRVSIKREVNESGNKVGSRYEMVDS
jgi:hypothetical protein